MQRLDVSRNQSALYRAMASSLLTMPTRAPRQDRTKSRPAKPEESQSTTALPAKATGAVATPAPNLQPSINSTQLPPQAAVPTMATWSQQQSHAVPVTAVSVAQLPQQQVSPVVVTTPSHVAQFQKTIMYGCMTKSYCQPKIVEPSWDWVGNKQWLPYMSMLPSAATDYFLYYRLPAWTVPMLVYLLVLALGVSIAPMSVVRACLWPLLYWDAASILLSVQARYMHVNKLGEIAVQCALVFWGLVFALSSMVQWCLQPLVLFCTMVAVYGTCRSRHQRTATIVLLNAALYCRVAVGLLVWTDVYIDTWPVQVAINAMLLFAIAVYGAKMYVSSLVSRANRLGLDAHKPLDLRSFTLHYERALNLVGLSALHRMSTETLDSVTSDPDYHTLVSAFLVAARKLAVDQDSPNLADDYAATLTPALCDGPIHRWLKVLPCNLLLQPTSGANPVRAHKTRLLDMLVSAFRADYADFCTLVKLVTTFPSFDTRCNYMGTVGASVLPCPVFKQLFGGSVHDPVQEPPYPILEQAQSMRNSCALLSGWVLSEHTHKEFLAIRDTYGKGEGLVATLVSAIPVGTVKAIGLLYERVLQLAGDIYVTHKR